MYTHMHKPRRDETAGESSAGVEPGTAQTSGHPPETNRRHQVMYVCMYVCMYVYMYVCTYIHTSIDQLPHVRIALDGSVLVYVHVYVLSPGKEPNPSLGA